MSLPLPQLHQQGERTASEFDVSHSGSWSGCEGSMRLGITLWTIGCLAKCVPLRLLFTTLDDTRVPVVYGTLNNKFGS